MDTAERQELILGRARTDGKVSVTTLAPELGVAVETVRRDLKVLSDRGVVQRVYGGAVAVETAHFETDLRYRAQADVTEKHRVAIACAQRRAGAETIFIDEGGTPQYIAEALVGSGPMTVVTASLPIAARLSVEPDITVVMLGGRVRGHTQGTVDHWAVRMLRDLVIDLAFIGANGISRHHGITTQDPAVAAVKTAAIERSRRRVLFGAHTKFGASSLCRFADLADFEIVITGVELPSGEASRFSAVGPPVIRV